VITGLHHVAVAVRELAPAAAAYERLLGTTPVAQDGGGAKRAWFWLDNMGLEIIAPEGDGLSGDRVRAQLCSAGEGVWLVAFAAGDFDATARLFERRGLAVSERTDRAVANFGGRLSLDLRLDRSNEAWGVRQLFFKAGDAVIEFGASLKAPASDGPDSFGGLAWRVPDPVAAQAAMAAAGFNVSEVRARRKPGTHVITVRDAPAGVPTLMLSAEPLTEAA
jgi:catechol 2,3-dioxygenase-like lactoylglutathione lyase family enzyme